ncbi:ribonuclease H-like domain-containing protein [Anoxybacillus tepidamans]|uniref:ribonuclease H-like domain-containing protein n=1 Tax=Anoxybacteroides tepidamans TaxID=265948 RepID=UPI000480E87C
MSLKQKLARLKGHMPTHSPVGEPEREATDIPYLDKWRDWNAEPFFFDGDYCFIREVVYPLDARHGMYRLGDLHDVHNKWQRSSLSHPLSSAGHDTSDLFFFDTETTGLGSGAGNTIFLLGHARVYEDRVVVRQHFLPHPGAEVALYQSFLSEVDYTTLVTYNGKAFDWPVVKTRHTLIRDHVPKLPAFGHFDLYHAARRIWRYRLESLRLAQVEKNILGVERTEDVPGFLAPMLYFDFLSTKHPDSIAGVLRHNEMDVLSLIALYIHLSKQILQAQAIEHASEQLEMARWFDAVGEADEAKKVYGKVAESDAKEAAKAKWNLSMIYKKEKKHDEAIALWQELLARGNDGWSVKAAIELAKVYEHHYKQPERAYEYAQIAYHEWKELVRTHRTNESPHEFLRRLERLERKIKK